MPSQSDVWICTQVSLDISSTKSIGPERYSQVLPVSFFDYLYLGRKEGKRRSVD